MPPALYILTDNHWTLAALRKGICPRNTFINLMSCIRILVNNLISEKKLKKLKTFWVANSAPGLGVAVSLATRGSNLAAVASNFPSHPLLTDVPTGSVRCSYSSLLGEVVSPH